MLVLFACSKSSDVAPNPPVTPPPTTVEPPKDTVKQPPKDTTSLPPKDTVKQPPVEIPLPNPASFTVEAVNTNGPNITNYLLYLPDGYNADESVKWPVVIYLHGQAGIGADINVLKNSSLPRMVNGQPFVMVAPQCRTSWWNMDALELFYKAVISKYRVDPNRVYLAGASMGGMQTWDWAIAHPERFAAIVPVAGKGNVKLAANIKNMPVWAFHSANDETVGVAGSRDMVKALRDLGSAYVKYTEYPTGGHDAWTRAFTTAELYTWLLAQKK
ncbi:prolyl oligopeptidase family serine peptidase [Chitinophaga sp. G-6-1-13]|uniref:Prolyl oligopeptidase family serine peptidase n=1 Tax=Chitinophaga fulva TaxID=2728842 RepID=A0A848GGU2_9BACT|nr:prolyl oligopeptidase family serine peptidase [Chitinophaga fulva]NML37047.1 prolyl oligopeptidase family serine peptidase [Chitinophaga fulva]